MDSNGDCLGVVLAGGRSLRMGVDKARLRWQGRTLLEYGIACLKTAGCARYEVVEAHENRKDESMSSIAISLQADVLTQKDSDRAQGRAP